MRSYAAGRVSLFRRVRIPNALPHMFTGLKIATVLSMIGAIVGEYFGGPTEALGVKILNDSSYGNFTDAWAGIVMASLLGIVFYAVVALAERLTTGWHPSSTGLPYGMTSGQNGPAQTSVDWKRKRMKHRWVRRNRSARVPGRLRGRGSRARRSWQRARRRPR